MLSVCSLQPPISNFTFHTLGVKSSKMSKVFHFSQNSDLSLKLNPTRQQNFRGMLDFQNRTPYIKLLKFHVNRDNMTYLEKYNFQRKLVYQIEIAIGFMASKMSLGMVSDLDSES